MEALLANLIHNSKDFSQSPC